VTLSWWWCLPLGLGAALAGLARLVSARLRTETAAVRDARRALGLELGRARRAEIQPAGGRPDTYLDIR
jgi:hypothetical protein